MSDSDEARTSLTKLADKIKTGLSAEDVVIIAVIGLGFVGSAVAFVVRVDIPPIIVAVFLGSAVSALVYRFLGGIAAETTFKMGAMKVGGTMAALLGCTYFINAQLVTQTLNMDELFDPHVTQWFAMEKQTAVPIRVKIRGVRSDIPEPDRNTFANAPLQVLPQAGDFSVFPKGADFALGRLGAQELRQAGLYSSVGQKLEPFVVTPRLPPDSGIIDLDPIPFRLATRRYGGDFSRYALVDEQGNERHQGSIYRKQTEIVEVSGRWYVIAVVAVDHEPDEGEQPYAKFAIGEIPLEVR
jgi:hypothetical protein